MKADVLQWHEV